MYHTPNFLERFIAVWNLQFFLISLLKSSISPAQAGNILSEFPKEKFVKKFAKKNSFAIDTNLKIL